MQNGSRRNDSVETSCRRAWHGSRSQCVARSFATKSDFAPKKAAWFGTINPKNPVPFCSRYAATVTVSVSVMEAPDRRTRTQSKARDKVTAG